MPVYTYRCQSCGVQFEKTQRFNDKPLLRCPECRKGKVKRMLQPSAIVFKGSGWYATDQRSTLGPGSSRKDEGRSNLKKTGDKADRKPPEKETISAKLDDRVKEVSHEQ